MPKGNSHDPQDSEAAALFQVCCPPHSALLQVQTSSTSNFQQDFKGFPWSFSESKEKRDSVAKML